MLVTSGTDVNDGSEQSRDKSPSSILGCIIHVDNVTPLEKVKSKDLAHVKYGRKVMDMKKRLLESYLKTVPFYINVVIGETATRASIDRGAQCMVMCSKLLKKALDVDYTAYPRILKRNANMIQSIEETIDLIQVPSITTVQTVIVEVTKVSVAWTDWTNQTLIKLLKIFKIDNAELEEFEKEAVEMSRPPNGCHTKQYLVRDSHMAYGQPQICIGWGNVASCQP
uniref:Uncharacterized protein n=1 Tax=Romanomermis culicivorax TaxID=13658 RepID=A0A915HHS9_ROMCU